MWKKFFIAILSIALVGGASIASDQLFAASAGDIQIKEKDTTAHYIHDAVDFVVSTTEQGDTLQYIEGGSVKGNGENFTIPLLENTDTFSVSGFTKPGTYQGSIKASIKGEAGVRSIEKSFTFTLYGKVFSEEAVDIETNESRQMTSYGLLPSSESSFTYLYSSNNEDIVTIDKEGRLLGRKPGEASVTLQILVQEQVVSTTICQVHVKEKTEAKLQYETAIQGEEYGYRFLPLPHVDEEKDTAQSIGYFQLGQSGEHAFYFEDAYKDKIEVRDGYVYPLEELEKKEHSITAYILHKDSSKLYAVRMQFTSGEEKDAQPFVFRYQGKVVQSIVRPYEYGNNSFQIASNQSIEQVTYRLKNDSDAAYVSISQTGNVTVKAVTKDPVIVTATYQKEVYELPITIEKSEQIIKAKQDRITFTMGDGVVDPLIDGRKGEGSLVFASKDASIVDVLMHEDGTSSLLPKRVGKTEIEIFNNGDDTYKKSNVITIQVEVVEEKKEPEIWEGNSAWLTLSQPEGKAGWYTGPVSISLKEEEEITAFSYQGEWRQEIEIIENGEIAVPITFQSSSGEESTPITIMASIDMQAPRITGIKEEDAANSVLKEFINQITFEKGFGRGKNITIDASDLVMDPSIKTSGVHSIQYAIYALEEGNEELLLRGEKETVDSLSVQVEDTRVHKVCAKAMDHAGLQGEETCQILSADAPQLYVSANTGLIFRAKAQSLPSEIVVVDGRTAIPEEQLALQSGQLQAAYAFVDAKMEKISLLEDMEVQLPISQAGNMKEQGIWKQAQADGSFESIPASYTKDTCTLKLSSLAPIIYVQEETVDNGIEKLLQTSHPAASTQHSQIKDQVTPLAVHNFVYTKQDLSVFAYAGGAVLLAMFVIVLIRSAYEDEEYENEN